MQFLYCKQLCDCKISSFRMHHNAKHGLFYSGMPANGWNLDLSFSNRQCHAVNFLQIVQQQQHSQIFCLNQVWLGYR
jgi:hypothetical protein